MINKLPFWIELLFIIASVWCILFFYFSNAKSKRITFFILLWSLIQSLLAYNGFYQVTDSTPPRFVWVLLPTTLVITYGLLPRQQEWFLKARNTKWSTLLHLVRLPVELVLHALFLNKMVPELMTFEGRNFDILMGITAPLIAYLILKKKIAKKVLLIWNYIGLALVLFILVNGILSAELPFQLFGFEQPNRAINYFPFILLPATVVPIVIWTHLSDIIKLRKE